MFNIVSKSLSLSFSGGSIAIAPPSLNFRMQPCQLRVGLDVDVDGVDGKTSPAREEATKVGPKICNTFSIIF